MFDSKKRGHIVFAVASTIFCSCLLLYSDFPDYKMVIKDISYGAFALGVFIFFYAALRHGVRPLIINLTIFICVCIASYNTVILTGALLNSPRHSFSTTFITSLIVMAITYLLIRLVIWVGKKILFFATNISNPFSVTYLDADKEIIAYKTDRTDFLKRIENGLNNHNYKTTGQTRETVNFILEERGIAKGGIKAFKVGKHFFISWLYISPELREKGYGRKLIGLAEKTARHMSCIKIFVDTMSFQAPRFYEALNFSMVARIPDFYEGYDRIFYQKNLFDIAND